MIDDGSEELSGAPLERLISAQLSGSNHTGLVSADERKKIDMLRLHKSEVEAEAKKPDVGGLSCVLLCQIGCLSSEAPDQAVGSFARALMDFQHLLESCLNKHGARTVLSNHEFHTIVARDDMQKELQLHALYQVAKDLLKGSHHIFFQWPHGQDAVDDIHVEVRMGMSCGQVLEGVLHDGDSVIFGQCVDEAWELVESVPSMHIHFSESAVDELKNLDSSLRFVQNCRSNNEKTGAKVPDRCVDPLNIRAEVQVCR